MKKVQAPKDYLNDLIAEIDKAQKIVLLQTMLFEYGKIIGRLEKHLIKAAKRGVEVRVNYDWVAKKYIHGDLPMLPLVSRERRNSLNRIQKRNDKMYARLEDAGVILVRTNDSSFPVSQFPYLGRSHIKFSVVDDCAWVGGVNLYDGAFENVDVMVKSHKPNLIAALYKLFYQVNDSKNPDDYKVKIDDKETLYVDTGRIRKSIIYDCAKKKIRKAKNSIIFISQFVPDTKLLKEIAGAADRNVVTTIMTSPSDDPLFTNYPEKLSYIVLKNTIEEKDNIKLIHLSKRVHAKVIMVDNEVVLFGSHNFTYSGVLFGTAESMIETHEESIIKEFKSLFLNGELN